MFRKQTEEQKIDKIVKTIGKLKQTLDHRNTKFMNILDDADEDGILTKLTDKLKEKGYTQKGKSGESELEWTKPPPAKLRADTRTWEYTNSATAYKL
jgi:hypothetical protein